MVILALAVWINTLQQLLYCLFLIIKKQVFFLFKHILTLIFNLLPSILSHKCLVRVPSLKTKSDYTMILIAGVCFCAHLTATLLQLWPFVNTLKSLRLQTQKKIYFPWDNLAQRLSRCVTERNWPFLSNFKLDAWPTTQVVVFWALKTLADFWSFIIFRRGAITHNPPHNNPFIIIMTTGGAATQIKQTRKTKTTGV